jgi:hypothetical protein
MEGLEYLCAFLVLVILYLVYTIMYAPGVVLQVPSEGLLSKDCPKGTYRLPGSNVCYNNY